jgi:hypothetical protein
MFKELSHEEKQNIQILYCDAIISKMLTVKVINVHWNLP